MLFVDSDMTSLECENKVSHLESEVVTLMGVSVESSMIATTCWNREEKNYVIPDIDYKVHIPIAIPIDLKISITVYGDKLEEDGSVYEDIIARAKPENTMDKLAEEDGSMYVNTRNKKLEEGGTIYENMRNEFEEDGSIYENTRDN